MAKKKINRKKTTGQQLIQTLGLENIDNNNGDIYIARVLITSSNIINIIYFDSRRFKLSKQKALSLNAIYNPVVGGKEIAKGNYPRTPLGPLLSLDLFNGVIANRIFVLVDLAYSHLLRPNVFTRLPESNQKEININSISYFIPKLSEITLFDLRDKGNISDINLKFRKERNKLIGTERTTAKLLEAFLNEANNSVTFVFQTEATPKYSKDYKYKRVSPLNLDIIPNTTKKYEIQVKVLDFFSWLKTQPEGQPITVKDLKDLLSIADVQIFNTAPFFQYGSINYNLSQIDASAYPTDIAPKVWDQRLGGDFFVDKHIYGILRAINTFLDEMTKELNKKLKQRGFI